MTHTPGPWKLGYHDMAVFAEPIGWEPKEFHPHFVIAQCNTLCTPRNSEEAKANARLIAAAPEMLDALKVALDDINSIIEKDVLDGLVASPDDHTLASAHRMVWCAIARAEGQKEEP